MDAEIIADYVRKLDMNFHAEDRKVAPIIDNYPAHPNVYNLNLYHSMQPPKLNQWTRES